MKQQVSVLSVCGSGTVTSTMVASKLKDKLKERGISVSTTEARPTEAPNLAASGRFDLIVFTSPLPTGEYKIPTVNAMACLTGVGEDEFFVEVEKVIKAL